MTGLYKIADVVISATFKYAYSAHVCSPYVYNGTESPEFIVEITESDLEYERGFSPEYATPFLENLSFLRKLAYYVLQKANGTLFHCSAVEVNGKAYLFTAPSGTGKSTHARLWKKLLGDLAVIINDDKPIIRKTEEGFFVYGTPWQGKHDLGENRKTEIKALCLIKQAKQNSIRQASLKEFFPVFFNQSLRPQTTEQADNLLKLGLDLLSSVKLYILECNTDISSAKLSYGEMTKE